MPTLDEIRSHFKKVIAHELGVSAESISDEDTFFELGLDSINAVYLLELIEQHYKITISPLDFWDYPTLGAFSQKVYQDHFQQ